MGHSVGIVGGGVAGLACARRLIGAGMSVRVWDKGRGPGGRLATRRIETPLGVARIDHGAQYVTARDPAFAAALEGLIARGAVASWTGRFAAVTAGVVAPDPAGETRYVGAPGMSALVAALGEGVGVAWGATVAAVARDGAGWTVSAADGAVLGRVDRLVTAIPAEQAAALLAPAGHADLAAGARTAPCWAGLFVFDRPLDLAFDAARLTGGALAWAARGVARPGRTGPETLIVHAGPDWSIEMLDQPAETVADALFAAFAEECAPLPAPVARAAHRWRYARTVRSAGSAFAWRPQAGLAVVGDWRLGARVECAWLSGDAAGAAIAAAD